MNRSDITKILTGNDNSTPEAIVGRPCAIFGIGTAAVTLGTAYFVSSLMLATDCPEIPTYQFKGGKYVNPTFQQLFDHSYCVDRVTTEKAGGIMPSEAAYAAGSSMINGHFVKSRELRDAIAAGRAGDTASVRAFDGKNWYDLTAPTGVRAVNEMRVAAPNALEEALRADSIANPLYR